MRGVFEICGDVAGLSIGIVDDVITTGATTSELALALKAGGAVRVVAISVARV
jgi:predicted amidophosphoribosyltransferase